MKIEIEEGRGQKVGSRIRLVGRVFGIELSVEEIVTERNPPQRKVWETVGSPRLLVIGHYRMGFELSPEANGSLLRVFIEYAMPERAPARWLGRLLAGYRWCTQRMVDDAVRILRRSRRAAVPQPYMGERPYTTYYLNIFIATGLGHEHTRKIH